jgi:uncharacterized protein (DUF1501 family)
MTDEMTMTTVGTSKSCGCPDFRLSRRGFLTAAGVASGLAVGGTLFGEAFRQVAFGAEDSGNVLVVLSLRGGSDGLSMVVPRIAADVSILEAKRPSIHVPQASLIGGNSSFGLHPAFAPLLPLWNGGSFAAVHAVGLPAPNRSHFSAMEEVEEADPGSSSRVGWVNRMIGLDSSSLPESVMQLGSTTLPTALAGPSRALATDTVAGLQLPVMASTHKQRRASLRTMWGGRQDALGEGVREALGATRRLGSLAAEAATDSESAVHTESYPTGPLQAVLANTAALIRADVGTKVVTIDYGDWDMHTALGKGDNDPTKGWMSDQVTHLAGSLAAFFSDLGAAAPRVTVVTISEFGRRLAENGDHGVDHGYGNAMLLLGNKVRGGDVYGSWPGLSALADGDLATTRDYRSVLWEVLLSLFPDVSGNRAGVFPNFTPEAIGAMA